MPDSLRVADRDWFVEARVRLLAEHTSASVDPVQERRFRAGEECAMVQSGLRGRPVDRSRWWSSHDVDGAFSVPAEKVEVVAYVAAACPFCRHSASGHDELGCLVETIDGRSESWIPEQCECCEPWGGLPAPLDDAELMGRLRMEPER